jgi:hypothetical protein
VADRFVGGGLDAPKTLDIDGSIVITVDHQTAGAQDKVSIAQRELVLSVAAWKSPFVEGAKRSI